MSKTEIDIPNLQRLAREAKAHFPEKERKDKEEQVRQNENSAQMIAQIIIKSLPGILEEEAKKGNHSAELSFQMITPWDKRAAEIIIEYCERQGLKAKIRYGSLVVSFPKDS